REYSPSSIASQTGTARTKLPGDRYRLQTMGPETPSTVEAWEACLSSESPLQQNKTTTAAYPIAQTELDSMSSENWCACANPNGYANQMAMTAKEPARNPRSISWPFWRTRRLVSKARAGRLPLDQGPPR